MLCHCLASWNVIGRDVCWKALQMWPGDLLEQGHPKPGAPHSQWDQGPAFLADVETSACRSCLQASPTQECEGVVLSCALGCTVGLELGHGHGNLLALYSLGTNPRQQGYLHHVTLPRIKKHSFVFFALFGRFLFSFWMWLFFAALAVRSLNPWSCLILHDISLRYFKARTFEATCYILAQLAHDFLLTIWSQLNLKSFILIAFALYLQHVGARTFHVTLCLWQFAKQFSHFMSNLNQLGAENLNFDLFFAWK